MAVDLVPHEGDLEPDEDYESVLFDAVRSRYAHLHGIAMLPEIDRPAVTR